MSARSRLLRFRFNWPLALWVACALVAGGLLLALIPINLRTVLQEPAVLQSYLTFWPAVALRVFANMVVAARYAGLLVFLAVAGLIVWRRPHDRMGLIVALMLVTLPLGYQLGGYSDTWLPYPPAWRPVLNAAYQFVTVGVGLPALIAFGLLFPTGRAEPRWLGRAGGGLAAALYVVVLVGSTFPLAWELGWLWPVGMVGFVTLFILVLGSQAYRYLRVSSPAERRQTRLVVLGIFVFSLGLVAQAALAALGEAVTLSPRVILGGLVLGLLTLVALPASIGVAILRYGLWEIDVIIRRTLIYTVLTGLLALTYFGAVVLLQSLVRLFTGQSQSPLVSVVSTLTIAALFVPLRRRVQAQVDRRFYRRKYDAARTVAAFGAALRAETALEQVTAQLVNVAAATVQPSHVSLWLPHAPLPRRPAERLE